ncbi:DUF6146 family protein [Robiginitalea sp. SC105]|uniref:DUF6146 family protein n=1 Tax=Robiginitalea sp. SC105 TaxID=2762332 RepID=UPI00163AD0CE|nr:DUF6146 family protein [Robiginitalea sp. SC105]MBC2840643.1 hypothetical protein [Robiginitalea sp. SC105]
MKLIIQSLAIGLFIVLIASCSAQDGISLKPEEREVFSQTEPDSVRIADTESKYEIIIIEPGFYNWLVSIAKPEGYYSQTYLENRNQLYVTNWNQRALQPADFGGGDLYIFPIDYDPQVDYGYEVNYKLFNYFIYFQRKYKQRLGPWLPRI